jgi:hypothetical protein
MGGSWTGGLRNGLGLLKVIQQRGQPLGILQKEPSQHRLKSRGLAIAGRVPTAGSPAGTVAAASHQCLLPGGQQGLQPGEGLSLGFSPHLPHHGAVQISASPRLATLAQALMQFPNGIAEPGELEGAKLLRARLGEDPHQPVRGRRGFRLP